MQLNQNTSMRRRIHDKGLGLGEGGLFHNFIKAGLYLTLTCLVFFSFPLDVYSAWYNPGWGYRKAITVQSGQVPGAQSNFPMFINITDADLAAKAQPDFDDILFTDSLGNKLKHEIEKYNSGTGELVAWVNVPSISDGTVIYMYYGNTTVGSQEDINGTWNSNYGIVYHMNTSGTDSTSNSRDRIADVGSPSADNSFMGYGLSFGGSDAWSQSNMSYWEQEWNVRSHEIVFKTAGDVTTRQTLFAEGAGVNGVILYIVSNNLYARWWSESQGWSGGYQSTSVSINTTYHVILSYEYSGGDYELFVNGSSAGSTSTTVKMSAHSGDGGIAYTGPNGKDFHDLLNSQGHYFIGSIYEFRVRDNKTDSSYATTTYKNQSSPSNFYNAGSEESAPVRYWVGGTGNWSNSANWAATSGGAGGAGKPSANDMAIFDANSGGGTCTLDEAVSIESFNMKTGNTTTVATNNYTITTSGNFTIAAGTFNANSSTINVGGNWDSSSGDWNSMTSTVNLTGTGTLAQYTASSPWSNGFYNLSVAAAGETTTTTSSSLWVGKLTVGSGTFTDGPSSYTVYLQGTGDVFVDGGANITLYWLIYRVAGGSQNVVGRDYTGITQLRFNTVGGASGSGTYNMQGNITANDINIEINNGGGQTRNSVLNTNNYSITADNLYVGTNGDTNNYALLNAGSSSVDINGDVIVYPSDASGANEIVVSGTSNWTVSGNWTNDDTFTITAGTSTVAFDGAGTSTISGDTTFNNLTCTTASKQLTFTAGSNQTISGTLTLTGTVGSEIKLRSSAASAYSLTFPNGAQTVSGVDVQYSNAITNTVTANNSINSGNNNANWIFGNVTRYWVGVANGEDWDDNSNWSSASNACGTGGGADYPQAGDTAIFDGSCTNNITLDAAVNVGAITNAGGYTGTFTTSNNNVTVSGNFQWDGGTFDASTGTPTITVGGDWDSSGGTFTYGTSTVDLTGTGNLNTASQFYNLTMAAAGQTTTLLSNVGVNNVCTVGNAVTPGTLSGASRRLGLYLSSGKPFVNNGAAITLGTLRFEPSGAGTITLAGGDYGTITDLLIYRGGPVSTTVNLESDITNLTGTISLHPTNAAGSVIFNTNDNNITATGLRLTAEASSAAATVNVSSSSIINLGTGGFYTTDFGWGGTHTLNLLGSATVNCAGDWKLVDGTATITQNANSSTVTFDGSGTQTITSNSDSYNNLVVTNNSDIVTFADAFTAANFTATTANTQLTFNDGSTYTISGASGLDLDGQAAGTEIHLRSSTPGTRYTLNVTGGAQTVSYIDVQDSNASGSDITANNSIDRSNNDSGEGTPQWVFGNATRYWVGVADGEDWDDNNNWSSTSNSCGTGGGADYPQTGDTAIFDGSCTNNITLDAAVTVGAITNAGGYTGTFTTSNNNVTVSGNFQWDGGTFDASTGTPTITVGGDWDSSGGAFTYGTSTIVLKGSGKTLAMGGWPNYYTYNLTIDSGASITASTLVRAQNLLTVTGSLTGNAGIWVPEIGTMTINSGASLTIGTGTTFARRMNSSSTHLQNNGGTITCNGTSYIIWRIADTGLGSPLSAIDYGNCDMYFRVDSVTPPYGATFGPAGGTFSTTGTLIIGENGTDGNGSGVRTLDNSTNSNTVNLGNLWVGQDSGANDIGELITGDATYNITGDVIVSNQSGNELDCGANDTATFNVGGDWTVDANASFVAGSCTVNFNGSSAQGVTSNGNAFNAVTITNSSAGGVTFTDALTTTNLTATTANTKLTFNAGSTNTISGTLDLNGQAASTEIQLRSSSSPTRWTFDVGAGNPQTVSYVDVQDSNASGSDITANNSIDRSNNDSGEGTPQWVFGNATRYWVGGAAGCGNTWTDNDCWSTTSGGSGGADYPDTGDAAIFDGGDTNGCNLNANVNVAIIDMQAGYTGASAKLDANGFDITTTSTLDITDGELELDTNSDLTVAGVFTVDGGLLDAANGTIDANSSVALSAGTLTAPSGNFNIADDFTHSGGTFTNSSGTVIFDSAATSTISGDTTFNNLTCTTDGKQLTFTAGTNQTISGTLTLTGAPGNLITLRSSSSGNKWNITLSGAAQSVSLLDVQDSDANTNTVTCVNCLDSGNNNANWLFDPFGTVFDSLTNNPIQGAVVSLWYDTGGGTWILARPGIEIGAGDTNPQTTGAGGTYNYLTINGTFRFTITADGYTYPSTRSSFPAGRIICPGNPACSGVSGSKGEQFVVAGLPIQMDLPMDSGAGLIKLTKKANKKEANIGDIVTYTVTIKNETAADVVDVYITDRIPAGFKYITDRVILDNQKIDNPEGQRPITFNIGTITAGQTRVLKYQLIIGSGVTFGKYQNSAWARYTDGTVISNIAREQVKIIPDPLFDLGTVIGKVFWDRNENGVQDSLDVRRSTLDEELDASNIQHPASNSIESGIANVQIVTEEGTVITTDKDGKYHLAGVTPGRHILRIDERTLLQGACLTTDKAVIIDITPGILQKVNFGVNKTPRKASPRGEQSTEHRTQTIDHSKQTTAGSSQLTVDSSQSTASGTLTPDPRTRTTENDFIFVGLADVKAGLTDISGDIEPVGNDDKFKEGFWSEGRVAYYLKGKIKGKYLITSSLDTDRQKKELFRNLDPDKYYPVYGDESTVNYEATDTQGMLYLAIEWDESKAMWGNYHTGITDTELAQFNRSLYGGKLYFETVSTTEAGKPLTKLIIFQAQAKQKAAHNEFLGTGGSLYYLKHRPIIEGSEKVVIEIRDKNTGLVIAKVEQTEGEDYEIDYSNGRIMFYQPVSQIAGSNSIISTALLDGNLLYVVVDYEYEVNETTYNEWSYGGRVEQSLTALINNVRSLTLDAKSQEKTASNIQHLTSNNWIKDIRLGGTYIRNDKDTGKYELKGIDTTLYLGEHTMITGEYAESKEQGVDGFVSTDGGLSFTELSTLDTAHGKAYSLKAQTNLYDKIALTGYYKRIEKGFSDSSTISGQGKESAGAEIGLDLTEKTHLKISHDTQRLLDEGNTVTAQQVGAQKTDTTTVQITHDMDRLKLTGEYRRIEIKQKSEVYDESETNEEGDTAALRADYEINKDLSVFLEQQATLRGEDNHQTTAGVSAKLFGWLNIKASETIGTEGNATLISTTAKVDSKTELYNTYSLSNSRIDGRKTSIVTGGRKKITDKMDLTTETQSSTSSTETSKTNIFGLSGELNERWGLSGSFERGIVQSASGSISKRNAGSIGVSYVERERIKASSKIELRVDEGQENRWQYLSYNAIQWKVDRNTTLFGKINLSESRNTTLDTTEAQYKELVFGSAYRPVNFDRLNLLAKYTYLEDETASGQSDMSDIEEQRAHVVAAEAVYDLTEKWQVVKKIAFKQADEKVGGFDFTKTQTWLWINRVNYNLYRKWQVGAEYRILKQRQAKDMKQGALIEVARYIGKNIQIGVGYNFTDFNDDLTYLDYTSQGPFIRLSAKITD